MRSKNLLLLLFIYLKLFVGYCLFSDLYCVETFSILQSSCEISRIYELLVSSYLYSWMKYAFHFTFNVVRTRNRMKRIIPRINKRIRSTLKSHHFVEHSNNYNADDDSESRKKANEFWEYRCDLITFTASILQIRVCRCLLASLKRFDVNP